MDFSQRYNFDVDKCEGGVWFPFGTGRIKLARFNSKRHKSAQDKHARVNALASMAGVKVDEDTAKRTFIKIVAEGIIVEWEGFSLNGQPYAYTPENAEAQLVEHPDFLEDVFALANNYDAFRREAVAVAVGNSPTS